MSRDDLEPEYLTRSDIARILNIDPRTAGRLMDRIPTLRIGKSHRRVLRTDFEAWSLRERELSDGGQQLAKMHRASCPQPKFEAPRSGPLIDAARRGGS